MGFIDFIRSRFFWINVLIAIVLLLGIVKFTMGSLRGFTHHGESIIVPDLHDLAISEVEEKLTALKLEYLVNDSSYIAGKKPNVILDQDPPADSKVKEGRTIYLTVNASLPPKVKMPDLIDVSFRQAEAILLTFGLKVGTLIYKPDLAKNAVLGQHYKGSDINPGIEIPKGSVIDLVLGDGLGNSQVPVPNLIGLTKGEALFVLKGSSLNIGSLFYDHGVRDSTNAKVYKQSPESSDSSSISQGEAVDLYLN